MRPARGALHAVVLAGGAGERFWPASRNARPKPLLRVVGGRSLLAATLQRARRAAGPGRVWLVCGPEHAAAMRRESGLPASRVLVEPRRRDTALAIALAALRVAREDPTAVLAVLPADHRIDAERAFVSALRRAAQVAAREGALVTLGVRPTRPDTGYGYIRLGSPLGSAHPGLHRVRRFVEKPDAERARRYVRDGGYLWNAGIFVWTPRAVLEEIEAHAPELAAAVEALSTSSPRGRRAVSALERAYQRAPSLSIDRAVLERSRRVVCLPVSFSWSDVGTWQRLAESLGANGSRSAVVEGEVVLCDAPGNLVWGRRGRPLALLGVEGLAVIDAGDAVLVARLERSDELRRIVTELRGRGLRDLV